MSVYRNNESEAPTGEQATKLEIIAGGRVHREGGHNCKPPGWWPRMWNGIHYGDAWECMCGMKWVWSRQPGPHIKDMWVNGGRYR